MLNKLHNKFNFWSVKAGMIIVGLLPTLCHADTNPWNSSSSTITGGDVAGAVGTAAKTDLKWVLLVLGGLLCIGGIMGVINLLMKDVKEREHSNMVVTIILIGLAITAGVLLITYGWTGLSGTGPS